MSDETDMLGAIVQTGGDPADLPFWQGTAQGQFLLHRCRMCDRSYWPASRCIDHGDAEMAWVEASGRGEVYTYTVMHHAYTPEMKGRTPYAVAVVKLEEGPFYHANIVDCPVEAVQVGLAVEVIVKDRHPNGLMLPMFKPIAAA